MIKLQKVSLPEVKKLIEISYEGDHELMQKYHVKPDMQYWDCVNCTLEMIEEVSAAQRMKHYKVIYKKQPIGYVSAFDGFLYSFGMNIHFRKKEVLSSWWDEIKSVMGEKFATMLFRNNSRTISHLIKQGFKLHSEDKINNTISLVYGYEINNN